MTEIPLLQTHAVSQPSPRAPFAPAPYGVPNGRPLDGPQQPEDDNVSDTIKCVCGYELDDGSSVLCELCRTWQHVLCYYDNEAQIPRVHECADCHPRPLEQRRIKDRQKTFRDMENVLEKKHKRPAPKSHKKKPKDTIALTNGHDEPASAIERKSGSPRDPQPPAKRPKTTHKSSGSVASLTQPSSRKRATSTAQPVLSPVKSPATPIANGYASDYFSEEFLRLYEHCDFAEIEANSFRDLGVTNSLHLWLKDPEETAKATGGKTPDQIFQRHDGTMKSLEETGPHLGVNKTVGALPTIQGPCPTWMWITVDADVPRGGFVGELKGQIGLRDEYCSNPDNRWPLLRHPRPFVFFPPSLPIYIDTRYEGTHLRYIRRSCRPNVRMQILITGESEYHFCFIATADIFAGDEITLGWDIDKDIQQALQMYVQNGNTREGGIQEVEGISHWVAGVLSNFGGCACSAVDCPLARCDRRNASHSSNQILKPHKKRKNGSHVSPLSTGQATNSRAGSEARRVDQDDDNVESRSVSGSTRSKPTSRDITPMTHASTENAVGLGVEMSDREKRKLMQQEKLFEQLEHNEQHAQKKRKRNSAGSALNTPSVASSVQLTIPLSARRKKLIVAQKQLGLAESSVPSPAAPKSRTSESNGRSSTMNGRRSNNSRRTPRAPKEPVPAPKPEYADQGTQTDPDPDCPSLVPVSMHVERRKPKGSFLRSLLQRTRDARVTRERSQSTQQSPPPLQLPGDRMELDEPENPTPSGQATLHRASSPQPKVEDDVEMQDASTATPIEAPRNDAAPVSPRSRPPEASPESPSRTSHPPLPPPPPPWLPTDDASAHNGPGKSGRPSHVDLPPLPTFSTQRTATQTPPPPSAAENTPPAGIVSGAPVAESPSHLTPSALSVPAPSPDVSTPVSVATPSPVQRKAKMSLSDWTAKRKAKLEAKSHEHDDRSDERDKERDRDIPSPATTLAPLQESSELKDGEQKANVGAKAEGKATDSA
ncbi:uncharacterized protein J3D65DRAFT_203015 [Phyllosticta citribraziliensis]|uniref:SET domain-containing protein n=1 Tax=Phyllosticta citribraziliensis TaxID=989973 RepID=A0ABR1M3J1_9PEZI